MLRQHDDVRKQRERPRDGAELPRCATVLRGDPSVVDRPLKAVNGLALVEQVENVPAENRVAEEIAEIKAAKQLAQPVAGFVDGIAGRGRAEAVEPPPSPGTNHA